MNKNMETTQNEDDKKNKHQQILIEEEQQDEVEMLETMNVMEYVSKQIETEDDQKRAEELEMSQTLQLLNQVVLLTSSAENDDDERPRTARGEFDDLQRQVRFCGRVKIAYLPLEESKVARQARKRFWGPGPLHDELWDGDSNTFRETELTPEQLAVINRRKTKVDKLRTFFRLRDAKIDVRAHAKRSITDEEEDVESDDFEKKDEDNVKPIVNMISPQNSDDQMENKSTLPTKVEKRRSTLKLMTSYIRSSVNPRSKSKAANRGSKEYTPTFHPIVVLKECAPLKGELENENQYQQNDSDDDDDVNLVLSFDGEEDPQQQLKGNNLWVNQPSVQIESH